MAIETKWRTGGKISINVYDGDRPVCQCQTAIDAARIVKAVNAESELTTLREQLRQKPAPVLATEIRELQAELLRVRGENRRLWDACEMAQYHFTRIHSETTPLGTDSGIKSVADRAEQAVKYLAAVLSPSGEQNRTDKESLTVAPEPEREWRIYPNSDTLGTRQEAEEYRRFYGVDRDIQWRTKAGEWQDAEAGQ